MRKLILTGVVSLLAFFSIQPGKALGEVPIDCAVEPMVKAIKYGDLVGGTNCIISAGGDTDQFTFVGKKNEKVILQATDQGPYHSQSACVTLRFGGFPTPNGNIKCNDVTARIDETLPADGTYTVVVEEDSNDGLSYGLVLERLSPLPSPPTTPLCQGCRIDDRAIDRGGDIDLFSFAGKAGMVIRVQATDRGPYHSQSACVTLHGPSGLPTSNGGKRCNDITARIDETLPADGTYTVVVAEGSRYRLSYTVDLQCFANCPVLPYCAGLFATLAGTPGDDVITGTNGSDVIAGLNGNDIIYGLGGNDVICGGTGDDRISGGTGNDRLYGETGNDVLQGDSEIDLLSGGDGNDTLDGGTGNDVIYGLGGNDTLDGGADSNLLNIDILRGGDGNDTLNGNTGNDQLFGENGNDTLNGNTGNDRLFGDAGHDTLDGGLGNDGLSGGAGLDVCDGNAGIDSLILPPPTCELVINIP